MSKHTPELGRACGSCRWRQRDFPLFWDRQFDRCTNPLAYGNRTGMPACLCDVERDDYSVIEVCGPRGKFWEFRPSLVARLRASIAKATQL